MFTKDEELFRMLHRVHAMTKMNLRHKCVKADKDENSDSLPLSHPPHDHGRGRMMGLLADEGEMIQTQLAARLDIRPQSLSEFLSKAEADGLIIRRQSEEDKRQTIVSLTDEGIRRVECFREAHRRHAEEFFTVFTEEEKDTLKLLLSKIIESK